MEKFTKLVGGKVMPLESLGINRQPVLTKIGNTPKVVCQFTGLLCDDVYCAAAGKITSGWVANPDLAVELLHALSGNAIGGIVQPTAKKNAVALAEAEKKKAANGKKKDKCFFKVDGTNIEKIQAVNELDAIRKVFPDNKGTFAMNIPHDDTVYDCFVTCVKAIDPKKWAAALKYDGKYEGKAPKIPILPIGLITCSEKIADSIPRLKMLLNEHAGKMPLKAKRVKQIKEKIQQEQDQEKFNHKHGNSKLRNVDKVPRKTPKRLRDIADPPVAPKKPRKTIVSTGLAESCELPDDSFPVEGCDSL